MNVEKYSEQEIEQVINSFKAYIKLVANHAAINYAKKLKAQKYKIVSLSELVEKELSLSSENNDSFLFAEIHIDNAGDSFTNPKYAKAFRKLSKKEQNVLILYSNNYSVNSISKKFKITETNVTTIKSRAVNKFKKYLKED